MKKVTLLILLSLTLLSFYIVTKLVNNPSGASVKNYGAKGEQHKRCLTLENTIGSGRRSQMVPDTKNIMGTRLTSQMVPDTNKNHLFQMIIQYIFLQDRKLIPVNPRNMILAPCTKRIQNPLQALAILTQLILNLRRNLIINNPINHAILLQLPQLLRQHFLRNIRHQPLQFTRPLFPMRQMAENYTLPFPPNHLKRRFHRYIVFLLLHHTSSSSFRQAPKSTYRTKRYLYHLKVRTS
ncbi:hypothetical protein QF028_005843 [Neobacillus sp. B4I6]